MWRMHRIMKHPMMEALAVIALVYVAWHFHSWIIGFFAGILFGSTIHTWADRYLGT